MTLTEKFAQDEQTKREANMFKEGQARATAEQNYRQGEESLARKLYQRDNEARAAAVAQRQQEALLMDIQRRMQAGAPVAPEEAGLYQQAVQGGVGMPEEIY